MQLNAPDIYQTKYEIDALEAHCDIRGQRVLELGCGAGWNTRLLVERLGAAAVVATEVDEIQHAKNLAITDLPGVAFSYGGAEAIDEPDASFDAVFMFKSLHHVPAAQMAQALGEIHRVLRPNGLACFSEPVYWGEFNELMSMIHDEKEVRELAFSALANAVEGGLFRLDTELFIQVPGTYESWEVFASRFIDVTHTDLAIDEARRARVRDAFERHLTADGAAFLKPHRIDLLRKSTAA